MNETKLIKLSQSVCLSCKYHMGVGTQPGKQQKAQGMLPNVGCNYMSIAGHSRIYVNGVKAYDSAYCDKYEPGEQLTDGGDLVLKDAETDEYERYKMQKVAKERKIPTV